MNYDSQELIARLADEYVLGTLRGGARVRFEKMLVSNEAARGAVRRAEDQLLGLSLALPRLQPAAATWAGISSRIGIDPVARPSAPQRAPSRSTWGMALAAAVALFALGIAWVVIDRTDSATATASLVTAAGAPLWNITTYDKDGRLTVTVAGAITPEADHSYELWALPDGAAPVSLGLLPVGGTATRNLTPAQRAALRAAPKVAVSLEPIGGSRTGAPTGPVLYVADLRSNPTPT